MLHIYRGRGGGGGGEGGRGLGVRKLEIVSLFVDEIKTSCEAKWSWAMSQ